MMQKSALRTTLLLAFLSMAPVAVAAPPNDDSTEEAACQLLVANMNAIEDLNEALEPQPVIQQHWPKIFSLYQQVFDKPDMPEADDVTQMLAVATNLREKNGASFPQEINEILDKHSRADTTHHLAGLNARLFQPIVGGIQAYLVKICLYYCNILSAENFSGETADILYFWQNAKNTERFNKEKTDVLDTSPAIYWEKLDEQYEQIFGPLTQNPPNNPSLGHLAQDAQQANTLIAQEENDETTFLKKMIRVNQDLAIKFPQSFLDVAKEHDAIKEQFTIVENPLRHLNMLFLTNALRCMKHQLSKTFGNNPGTLLEKIPPKEDLKPISVPRTPASLQQNARPTTPQIVPLPHTPPKTKQRTIFFTPNTQTSSAFPQSPVSPQPFHRTPAAVQPLCAKRSSPHNTPQASSMRTQMPTTTPPPLMPQTSNTPPSVPPLDSADSRSVTTPQIGSFPHPPAPATQTYTSARLWQNTRSTTQSTSLSPDQLIAKKTANREEIIRNSSIK